MQAFGNQNQGAYGVRYDTPPPQGYGGGYNPYPSFAPPAGPPPAQSLPYVPEYEGTKLPGYGADGAMVRDMGDDKEDPFRDGGKPSDDPFKDGVRHA